MYKRKRTRGERVLKFTIYGQMRESDGRVEIPVLFILIITHSIYYCNINPIIGLFTAVEIITSVDISQPASQPPVTAQPHNTYIIRDGTVQYDTVWK